MHTSCDQSSRGFHNTLNWIMSTCFSSSWFNPYLGKRIYVLLYNYAAKLPYFLKMSMLIKWWLPCWSWCRTVAGLSQGQSRVLDGGNLDIYSLRHLFQHKPDWNPYWEYTSVNKIYWNICAWLAQFWNSELYNTCMSLWIALCEDDDIGSGNKDNVADIWNDDDDVLVAPGYRG